MINIVILVVINNTAKPSAICAFVSCSFNVYFVFSVLLVFIMFIFVKKEHVFANLNCP